MPDDAVSVVAPAAVIAIAAGEIWLLWWSGRGLVRRWSGGSISTGRVACEVAGILAGALFMAWGAAITP